MMPLGLPLVTLDRGPKLASFCQQMAAWFPDMFHNFYLGKNNKIAKNLMSTKAREKISADLESLIF
jgi:hypothetical protein